MRVHSDLRTRTKVNSVQIFQGKGKVYGNWKKVYIVTSLEERKEHEKDEKADFSSMFYF